VAEASEADSEGSEEGCGASAGYGVLGHQRCVRAWNDSEQRGYAEKGNETRIHVNSCADIVLYLMFEVGRGRSFKDKFKAECRMLSADGLFFCLFHAECENLRSHLGS
jgi:hypothetical protein